MSLSNPDRASAAGGGDSADVARALMTEPAATIPADARLAAVVPAARPNTPPITSGDAANAVSARMAIDATAATMDFPPSSPP